MVEKIKKIKNPEVDLSKTLANLANNFLPDILRLRLEDGILKLYMYVNTGVVDKDGNSITDWKAMHDMYADKHLSDFLQGFIKGLETVMNFERIMGSQHQDNEFGQEV